MTSVVMSYLAAGINIPAQHQRCRVRAGVRDGDFTRARACKCACASAHSARINPANAAAFAQSANEMPRRRIFTAWDHYAHTDRVVRGVSEVTARRVRACACGVCVCAHA
jgi:hypothetical protein